MLEGCAKRRRGSKDPRDATKNSRGVFDTPEQVRCIRPEHTGIGVHLINDDHDKMGHEVPESGLPKVPQEPGMENIRGRDEDPRISDNPCSFCDLNSAVDLPDPCVHPRLLHSESPTPLL